MAAPRTLQVTIPAGRVRLEGELVLPAGAAGIVAFAHGSGSSRHSPRNRYVASVLHDRAVATLLFDLLTREEDVDYERRFDIALLTQRLTQAADWLREEPATKTLKLGFFGASTGAAAALQAAAALGEPVKAVVSRGGRPDLAGALALRTVRAPTLLIVGGHDREVLALNRRAQSQIPGRCELAVVPGAGHLFEEPGTLAEAAELAGGWFGEWLGAAKAGAAGATA
jgi:putative phosphoribosyl transferase